MTEGREIFWRKALLRDYADDCIYSVIVPTLMTTHNWSWMRLREAIVNPTELTIQAQRDNLTCCYCGVFVDGEVSKIAVRFMLARCPGTLHTSDDDYGNGTPIFMYRAAIGSASICMQCCAAKELDDGYLNANASMAKVMYDRLDGIATDLCHVNQHVCISGEQFLLQLLKEFCVGYDQFIVTIGKVDPLCGNCNKKNPPKCCTGCRYVHYCNVKCATADWSKGHRTECAKYKLRIMFNIRYLNLAPSARNVICSRCGAHEQVTNHYIECLDCHDSYYCTSRCQEKHREQHKPYCLL